MREIERRLGLHLHEILHLFARSALGNGRASVGEPQRTGHIARFVRRKERHWYSSDVLDRPGQPVFQNWDAWPDAKPELPHAFPSWTTFWQAGDPATPGALSSSP